MAVRFPHGRLVATPGALETLQESEETASLLDPAGCALLDAAIEKLGLPPALWTKSSGSPT